MPRVPDRTRGIVACAQRLALAAMALFALVLAAPQMAAAVTIANTATAQYTLVPGNPAILQNSNTTQLVTGILPTPAVVTFWQYAPPGTDSDVAWLVDGGEYDSGGGVFLPLPAPVTLGGTTIPTSGPVPLREAEVYHAGEPVFVSLADANRNTDPLVRDYIELTITTSTGDTEVLRLQETGPDTGIFAGVIQSAGASLAVTANDGRLSLDVDQDITADYVDPTDTSDRVQDRALVDPFGRVFDSGTGNLLDGVTVTLVDADTGLPAQVFGDDGYSTFPSTVVTGGTYTDSNGRIYVLPEGSFRFPFVAPGNYRFVVAPPGGYTAPSAVAPGALPLDGDGNPYVIDAGASYGGTFTVVPGPALQVDIPLDPPALASTLLLQKRASEEQASIGDFIRYALSLENRDTNPATNAVLTDTLPRGFRFEPGSLRVNGVATADPVIAADGRTLTIAVGNLPAGATVSVSYVVRVVAGKAGENAVNRARAAADGGLFSNEALAPVKLRDALMQGVATIIGRVVESPCHTPWDDLKGVSGVRLLMEDGTYVSTDRDGLYHVEGVRPGTHVVQIDLASLPEGYEPVSCIANTRFANRAFSQFVEVQGGALWRADFYLRPVAKAAAQPAAAPAQDGEAGLRLATTELEPVVTEQAPEAREYTFHGKFASCEAQLLPQSFGELDRLLAELRQGRVERLEVVGHTDNQRLSPACRAKFTDNHGLSKARARTIADYLASGLGLDASQISIDGKGPDVPLADNRTSAGMAQNRRVELVVHGSAPKKAAATDARVRRQHVITVDAARVALANLRVTTMLAPELAYVPGSSTLNGEPAADPESTLDTLTWRLPDGVRDGEVRIGFQTQTRLVAPVETPALERFTFNGRFASCADELLPESWTELMALMSKLRQAGAARLEVVGHTDNERLSPACQAKFKDNEGLSLARARFIARTAARVLQIDPAQIVVDGKGERAPVASNATPEGMARNRRVEVIVQGRAAPVEDAAPTCNDGYAPVRVMAMGNGADGKSVRLPVAGNRVACKAGYPVTTEDLDSGRLATALKQAAPEAAPAVVETDKDGEALSNAAIDWLAEAAPGAMGFLFPQADHNPRAPAIRVVVQHAPDQRVELSVNGVPASPISFDGVRSDQRRGVAVSVWRGVPLEDNHNVLRARVLDRSGKVVRELERVVHFASDPVRAELVPELSQLVADGIARPRIAVRLLDRDGKPVRAGVLVNYQLAAPYQSYESVQKMQERQLAGVDRYSPQVSVQGDDGVAYIELAPTTDSGEAVLSFTFRLDDDRMRRQEIRAWLASAPRDWVLVGFVEGTAGYSTLDANSSALPGDAGDGGYTDGQVSFYAKGRVLGKWLLTIAYDSAKGSRDQRNRSLLSTIDPDEFYTLYGDGAEQRYDAASQRKLYLKLEREQFYALFGDYETGLTVTELSRYSRTLNGLKVEKGGRGVTFTAFAAETAQDNVRDEIRGNGTSGLYQLSRPDIVINTERVSIEVRDRYTGAVLETRALARHLDYDIDYSAGTLFFREPIPGRDPSFNPVVIVTNYETMGLGDEEVSAGGRVGMDLAGGKANVGVTAITETQFDSDQQLVGVDATVRVNDTAEVRFEAAQTDGEEASLAKDGAAALVEYEHNGARVNALAYVRRQDPGFGLRQQNASEAGMQKAGAEGQYRLDERWSLTGEISRQDNLSSDAARDLAAAGVRWERDVTALEAGVQAARDESALGESFESEQLTLGAEHSLYNGRLDLSAEADIGLSDGGSANPDYPNRLTLTASHALNTAVRLIASQEFTQGDAYDTSLTRAGMQVVPWGGARLQTTLNQQAISEYGPRTFAQFGLTQSLLQGQHLGADVAIDSSRTFNESGTPAVVVNPNLPSAVAGGETSTEDYVALSGGLTYRAPVWSWNARLETRDGNTSDRTGFVTHWLRQASAGVAFALDAQAFEVDQATGTEATDLTLGLAWAYRPLGWHWSILERLEIKHEALSGGLGQGGLFGYDSLDVAGDGESLRIINNLALNRVSRAWTDKDRQGNLFNLNQRHQWSIYHGAKYVQDRIDGVDYDGFTHMLALEGRYDLTRHWDIGLQASVLHAVEPGTYEYSFGPSVGWSPFTNAWISVGYNVTGFEDPDFSQARYTAEGLYLKVRVKFDQKTRWRDNEDPPFEVVPVAAAPAAEGARP